ncbi:MAG: DUF3078 domain-containing protein [bacterium]|nr:MAG: DUF3078 domain-containing protein [bacterium]
MKFKNFIPFIVVLIFPLSFLFAQEKAEEKPKYGWQKEMVGGINLTQTSFDNWAQGGENQLAWQVNLNFKFVNDQEKSNWSNTGKLTYGATKTGDQEARKAIDEIKLESVFAYKLGVLINPFVAVTGETQFDKGYDYTQTPKDTISAFMDPAYFRESAGIGIKPSEIIKSRLGVSFKQTITNDYPQPYADDPSTTKIEKTKSEIGAESVTDVSWKVSENSLFTSKLELFSAFTTFQEIDVNWDNILTTKISKYFNVNFNFKLFYDRDISKMRQIKQAIALGVSYSFL